MHSKSNCPSGTGSRRTRLLACAAILCLSSLCVCAHATTYCAHNASELIADLADVSTNGVADGHDNIIHLVTGTFTTSGAPFTFTSASGFAFTLEGGYDGTCANQDAALGATVLDGGGTNQVLSIQTNGMVVVSHLTIQNGFRDGSSNGGGVGIVLNRAQPADPVPTAIFSDNVVRNNSSNYAVGGLSVFATAPMPDTPVGTVYVENCLFAGNSAPSSSALFADLGPGSTAYLTNNTITGNTSSNVGTPVTAIGDNAGALAGYVSNTISYGNTASYDFYLYINDSVEFVNNDYGSINGAPTASSSGNLIGVDPQFVAADDFRLRSTSPLLRAGTLTPAGGLPVTDIEGNPRSISGRVDLGAFENVDFIFADGFQAP